MPHDPDNARAPGTDACNFSPRGPAPSPFLPAGGRRWAGLAALLAIAGAGCGRSALAAEEDTGFTVVVLPDTQYYAAAHPEILDAQVHWIVDQRAAERIALVLHEGDIVDADEARQWASAARSLHRLDGVVPYVLTAGNHDYRRRGAWITRETSLNTYFPASATGGDGRSKGTFEPGHIEDSFEIVETPGGQWLILSLEFGPRDSVLAWADRILRQHAGTPAIVVTHAYLDSTNARYDHLARADQLWNPHRYLGEGPPGEVNDGEEIWRKLVAKNDNVLFVLCGHDLDDGVGRLTSVRADGTAVHQILANYQTGSLGGEGFLRLMRFLPDARKVAVRTYSPYTERFKADADNQFTLDY
jgi:hypothetical protein